MKQRRTRTKKTNPILWLVAVILLAVGALMLTPYVKAYINRTELFQVGEFRFSVPKRIGCTYDEKERRNTTVFNRNNAVGILLHPLENASLEAQTNDLVEFYKSEGNKNIIVTHMDDFSLPTDRITIDDAVSSTDIVIDIYIIHTQKGSLELLGCFEKKHFKKYSKELVKIAKSVYFVGDTEYTNTSYESEDFSVTLPDNYYYEYSEKNGTLKIKEYDVDNIYSCFNNVSINIVGAEGTPEELAKKACEKNERNKNLGQVKLVNKYDSYGYTRTLSSENINVALECYYTVINNKTYKISLDYNPSDSARVEKLFEIIGLIEFK